MRRIMQSLLLVASMSSVMLAQAGSWGITSISFGSGRSPVASGISVTTLFAPRDNSFYGDFTIQSDQAWLVLAKNFGKYATVGGSTGYIQDASWIGPYVQLSTPSVSKTKLSALVWPIYFGEEPEHWRNNGIENPETLKAGNFAQISLSVGRFAANYAWLDFLDDPTNWLPGVGYSAPLMRMPNLDLSASVTRNTQAKQWMYFMGATWKIR